MSLKIFKEKIHRKIGKKSSKLFLNINSPTFKILSLQVDDSASKRVRKISKRARNKIHRQRIEIPLCEGCNKKPAIYYKEDKYPTSSLEQYFADCHFKFPRLDRTKFNVSLNAERDTEGVYLIISHVCTNCAIIF